jgi:hypothetical protein
MSTSKQTVLIALMVAIGFSFGYWSNNRQISPAPANLQEICVSEYQRGMDTIYDRLISNGHADIAAFGFGFRPSNAIAGEVKEINGKSIFLTVSPMNALADPKLKEREVDLSKAKIYRYRQKTVEESQKDQEEFMKQMEQADREQAGAPLTPPEPFAKDTVSFDNLKVGDRVSITAGNNIHDQKTFSAEEIVLEMSF